MVRSVAIFVRLFTTGEQKGSGTREVGRWPGEGRRGAF
jgi:hypothetical protein